MNIFDTHCHLQDERIGPDPAARIGAAVTAGVRQMLCCGSSEDDWPAVRTLCAAHAELIPAFGLHPWYVTRRSANWLATLEEMLASAPGAAVGEIGLDHALPARNDAEQYEVFTAQLTLAARLNRPASIHCRKAWDALPAALEQNPLPRGFAIHSYSGPLELIPRLTRLGAFFSFSGSITRSGNKRGRKSAAAVPADRLLLETDSPDLPPVINGIPTQTSEPAHLIYVLRAIADLRHLNEQELAEITWQNSCRFILPSSAAL